MYQLRRLMPHKHDQRPWTDSGLGSKVEVCLWCGRLATEGFGDGTYLTYEEWLPLVRGWED